MIQDHLISDWKHERRQLINKTQIMTFQTIRHSDGQDNTNQEKLKTPESLPSHYNLRRDEDKTHHDSLR
jgi:hypothetical protein